MDNWFDNLLISKFDNGFHSEFKIAAQLYGSVGGYGLVVHKHDAGHIYAFSVMHTKKAYKSQKNHNYIHFVCILYPFHNNFSLR